MRRAFQTLVQTLADARAVKAKVSLHFSQHAEQNGCDTGYVYGKHCLEPDIHHWTKFMRNVFGGVEHGGWQHTLGDDLDGKRHKVHRGGVGGMYFPQHFS